MMIDIPQRRKMNYSRYIYFKSLVSSVLARCSDWVGDEPCSLRKRVHLIFKSIGNKAPGQRQLTKYLEDVENEIQMQVQKVYSDQEGGYWPITSGDLDFIKYLNKMLLIIRKVLSGKQPDSYKCLRLINRLKHILAELDSDPVPKINAVFFLQETFVWPSLESVYDAFIADPDCEAKLVYVPFEHVNKEPTCDDMNTYKDMGLPVIHCQNYDLEVESPDIAFFLKPYNSIPKQFYIDDVEKIVRRSVYIPYSVKWVDHKNMPLLIRYHFQLPLQDKAWKIFDTPKDIRESYAIYGKRCGENVETIGHPRFDSFHKFTKMRKEIPDNWKIKTEGRKVILWNTHFINRSKGNSDSVWATYEIFGEKILSYFLEDESLMLLWRPHPFFISGLLNSGIRTEKEIDTMKTVIEKSKNLILDTSSDYRQAFSIADALITDASGFLSEFLEVDKPILYTFNKEQPSIVRERLLPAFSTASTWGAVLDFIKLIKMGEDRKKEARKDARNYLGIDPQINVGKRVKEICIRDLVLEETSFSQISGLE